MFPHLLTIRSSPKEIIATEFQHLLVDLTSSMEREVLSNHGEIEILIPFDGNRHVNSQTIDDINDQKEYSQLLRNTPALIGYLNLQQYEKTDLDAKYELSLSSDMLVIDLGIKEGPLKSTDDLTSDKYAQRTELRYTPNLPKPFPISIQFHVTDEIRQENFTKQRMPKFERYLNFGFIFECSLNPDLNEELGERPIQITRLGINWPIVPSVENINAALLNLKKQSKRTPLYDPDKGQLVFEDVELVFNHETQKHQSSLLLIHIPEPGELYNKNLLEGTIHLEFPALYSGLKLNYFQTNGKLDKEAHIQKCTKMFVEYKLDLLKSFREKTYTPSQLLQFPNVVLDQMRVLDVQTILRDEKFVAIKPSLEDIDWESRKPLEPIEITAKRPEGAGTLEILIVLQGRDSKTERERAIPGDEKFITEYDTGGLVCTIQGQLPIDSRTVVNLINKIHTMMKERFRHVSILD